MHPSQNLAPTENVTIAELLDAWPVLSTAERIEGFGLLPRAEAESFFFSLDSRGQAELIRSLPAGERRSWMRLLPPDDAADVVQQVPPDEREAMLALVDEPTRKEVLGLLAYAEDRAGGLMNPRFARVRPEMSVDEAIAYLRKQGREQVETIYYTYVLDPEQHLLGVVSFRELFNADATRRVRDVMRTSVVSVTEGMSQREVSQLFMRSGLIAIPVLDAERRMKGIVTIDDIVHVIAEEATDDIQKLGGSTQPARARRSSRRWST